MESYSFIRSAFFALVVFLGSLGSANASDQDDVSQMVTKLENTPAGVWVKYYSLVYPGNIGSDSFSDFSYAVLNDLADRGYIKKNMGSYKSLSAFFPGNPAKFIIKNYDAPELENNMTKLEIGLYDSVRVIEVIRSSSSKCDWEVNFRFWVSNPTEVAHSVSRAMHQSLDDGFLAQNCYRASRSGFDLVYENFLHGEIQFPPYSD